MRIKSFKEEMAARRERSLHRRQQAKQPELTPNSDLEVVSPKNEANEEKRKVDLDRIFKLYNDAQKLGESQQ